jgi:hypothetical protein
MSLWGKRELFDEIGMDLVVRVELNVTTFPKQVSSAWIRFQRSLSADNLASCQQVWMVTKVITMSMQYNTVGYNHVCIKLIWHSTVTRKPRAFHSDIKLISKLQLFV